MEAKNVSGQNGKNGVWEPSSEFFIYDHIDVSKNTTKDEVDEFNVLQVDSKPASQITDHTDSCCFNAEVLAACQTTEYAKTHEKSSLSKLLNKSTPSGNLTSTPPKNQTCILEDSPKNVGSCTELHLGTNFITMEESADDDLLDRFECSDVMTDEAYQKLEEKLKFLLESDDEEDESILGHDCDGCAYFLSETPRLFQVSDNTMPIDAAIGFCSHQSKSKEVAVRRDLATCSPSTLQAGMTLTGGQQQSKVFPVKDKETCKLPVASMAIKNEYPRIEEENTSSNHSAADFSVVCLPGMEKGISGTRSSSNLDGSSATADKRSADRGLWKNPQHLSKLRKKLIEGKAKVSEASPTKSSKDLLKLSHSKELHTSPVCRILRERSYLDSSAQLCKEGQCISSQGKQDTVSPAKKIGLFRGEGRDVSGPREEGKRISCVSEGIQVPKESATLVVRKKVILKR
ncbi:Alpha-protein kinase 2 [Varanus komodoensis]|nr:Alpha-protein kinase 2 [Varanus komodoensis]